MVRFMDIAPLLRLTMLSLGQLIKIIRELQMEMVVDKLIEFSGGKDDELRDISALGASTRIVNRI